MSVEKPAIEIGLFFQRQGIGAGGGRHAPESEGGGNLHPFPDGRNGAVEPLGNYAGGLFSGGDEHPAVRDTGQQGRDVGGGDHFQEGVGGVVPEPPHFAGRVVEGQAFVGTELPDQSLVEALFPGDAEMVFVGKVDQADDAPEVVDPVGVVKRYAPAVGLRWEAPQEKHPGAFREEWLEGVTLYRPGLHTPRLFGRASFLPGLHTLCLVGRASFLPGHASGSSVARARRRGWVQYFHTTALCGR